MFLPGNPEDPSLPSSKAQIILLFIVLIEFIFSKRVSVSALSLI